MKKEIEFRRTFEDTKKKQLELKQFIRKRMVSPSFKPDQEEYYCDLIADALLSQGINNKCRIKTAPFKYIVMAETVHSGLLMMVDKMEETMIIMHGGFEHEIPTVEVWKQLYAQCIKLFPFALAESIHISAEVPSDADKSGKTPLATEMVGVPDD